jgi:hypothetical protein
MPCMLLLMPTVDQHNKTHSVVATVLAELWNVSSLLLRRTISIRYFQNCCMNRQTMWIYLTLCSRHRCVNTWFLYRRRLFMTLLPLLNLRRCRECFHLTYRHHLMVRPIWFRMDWYQHRLVYQMKLQWQQQLRRQ